MRTIEKELPIPLSSFLLRSRKRAELTQEELAERSGVSVNTIGNLEAGRGHLPRQSTLDLLVDALAAACAMNPQERADLAQEFQSAVRDSQARRRTAGAEAQVEHERAPALPAAGTLTFLVCAGVPDSARQAEVTRQPRGGLAALLPQIVNHNGGVLLEPPDEHSDAVAVFVAADAALAAADALLRALRERPATTAGGDSAGVDVPVCLALHEGWAQPGAGDYGGATRRRALRLARLGHGGQVLLSQATKERLGRTLPKGLRLLDLGTYSMSPVERPQPIYQLQADTIPSSFRPLRTLQVPPTNLPLQPTSFIGRSPELAAVEALLAGAPLVTLVGTGGCGKTRLALQLAAELLDGYRDGAWFVELAPLPDPALVAQAVATALELREQPGRLLLSTLLEALRGRRLLLVLDNCEHLVESCAVLAAAVLRSCPHVQLLATSRERLGIRGESLYRVPSLTLPTAGARSTEVELQAYESVQLFVDRARASHAEFALTAENAHAVAQVCARLGGIPLAIELAAARTLTLPVTQIAVRLDQSMGILTGGPRDVLPRHQTLRAALDWSWALLSAQEQVVLRRLAVFAGGCTCVSGGASVRGIADTERLEQ